jgi:predicted nuclease of predicted toxin-antitoxin system
MKIKLDENLPRDLANSLGVLGHDVRTVHDEGLIGCSDRDVWQAAQGESRFLITQDLDFSDSRIFAPGSHNGVLHIRLRSPSRENLIDRIVELFQSEDVTGWIGCFAVATERKIRLLKPPERSI